MKVKIKAHVYFTKYSWEKEGKYEIYSFKVDDTEDMSHVGQQEFEVEVPEPVKPAQQEYASFAEWAHDYVQDNLHKLKPAQQEPVVRWDSDGWGDLLVDSLPDGTLLYTSPPAQRTWVSLTDEELSEVYNQTDWDIVGGWEYERAIEAKLRSKNEDRN